MDPRFDAPAKKQQPVAQTPAVPREVQNQMIFLLDALISNYSGDKKPLLTRCQNAIFGSKDPKDMEKAFKTAILIALQRRHFGILNTTSLGKKLRGLINQDRFKGLKDLYFSSSQKESRLVSYRDLRILV